MKKLILFVSLIASTSAYAQQMQQSKFVPYTITVEDHTKIMNYLNEQPAKFSIPLMQALGELSQKAIMEEEKKNQENKK